MAFDFSTGSETAADFTDRILTAANDEIEVLMKKEFLELLEKYPWQFLQKFILDFCGAVDQNLAKEAAEYLEEFFNGPGSFVDFASTTDNSEAAIDAAREVQQKILSQIPSYLSNYGTYIAPLAEKLQNVPEARYAQDLEDDLKRAAQTFQSELASKSTTLKDAITSEAEGNNFLYPMLSVAEIIIGRTQAYGEALMESIPGFIKDAQELLDIASAAAQSAVENAAATAKTSAEITSSSGR